MERNTGDLDGLERCPTCSLQPIVQINPEETVMIICERHGHQALGDTLTMAKKHWNMYVTMTRELNKGKAA